MTSRPRKIALPRLLHVGAGCLPAVTELLEVHDYDLGCVLVGYGPGPSRLLADQVIDGLRAHGVRVLRAPGLAGRLDQAAATAASIIEEGVTTALAVGGGRVIDTVKLATARTRVPFVSVPTAVSNDGISSPVASLLGRDGRRASHAARMPSGIVVDVTAIGGAPPATIRAGVGDLVSNLTACLDWRAAGARGDEPYDAFAAMIAESAARPVLELGELDSPEARELVAQGLLLSGLAMAAAGTSRPGSGAEHLISHALDARLGRRTRLHGAQVALGTLVAGAAHGWSQTHAVRAAFRRLGVPTVPEDLDLTREDLVEAVLAAPAIRPGRRTVLTDVVHSRADAERLVDAGLPAVIGRETVAA